MWQYKHWQGSNFYIATYLEAVWLKTLLTILKVRVNQFQNDDPNLKEFTIIKIGYTY